MKPRNARSPGVAAPGSGDYSVSRKGYLQQKQPLILPQQFWNLQQASAQQPWIFSQHPLQQSLTLPQQSCSLLQQPLKQQPLPHPLSQPLLQPLLQPWFWAHGAW